MSKVLNDKISKYNDQIAQDKDADAPDTTAADGEESDGEGSDGLSSNMLPSNKGFSTRRATKIFEAPACTIDRESQARKIMMPLMQILDGEGEKPPKTKGRNYKAELEKILNTTLSIKTFAQIDEGLTSSV